MVFGTAVKVAVSVGLILFFGKFGLPVACLTAVKEILDLDQK
jgi:hypothetical protein